nr:MAG TPA: hypothetical protein [Caudoviricetes sp.]
MKIEINNGMYLKVSIDKTRNAIKVETYKKGQVLQTRLISEVDFVDLYNILAYSQDHDVEIFRLWEAK